MLNLTPHSITVGGTTFPPSGSVARVEVCDEAIGTCPVTGVPIVRRVYGDVMGLPEPGTPCLVSALVAAAVPGRPGVYAPDTGPTAVRNEHGQIVTVTRLVAA